ncbi:MAG: hypothetical protein H6739_03520 [Alphaproteobacteria bacterium]|nr:hypothetical protein [Alphaproteobacteria bacterium]
MRLTALISLTALLACGDKDVTDDSSGSDDTSVTDDTSTTDDTSATDDTGSAAEGNQLKGTFVGGAASVVAITVYGQDSGNADNTYVYGTDLGVNCSEGEGWEPQGTLCDESPSTDSPDVSSKSNPDSGATWYSHHGITDELMVGVLIVDACSDNSCTTVDFDEARIWQMYSDGKVTSLQLSVHAETGGTAPAWDDGGWTTITGWEAIGAGTADNEEYTAVSNPTVLSTPSQTTRYLRVEVLNEGTLGDPDFTELRAIKLFDM